MARHHYPLPLVTEAARRRSPGYPAALILAALLVVPGAIADSGPGHEAGARQTIGLFLGDTVEDRRDGGTLGVEYEYRFDAQLGVGLTAEHVFGDFDTSVFVLPIAYHSSAWKLYAGPGTEHSDEGNEALVRLGVEYGFEVGDLEISPQVDVDFVDGERLFVFGVVFAIEL